MERAAAAEGLEGQRRHAVYLRWEAGHRNQRWEADHFQLDVLVLPPRATRPVRPWLTVFVDAYSRLVMGWALAVTPSAATVLAALRQGLLVDPDRGPFSGLPGCLRPDRGLEFAATAIRQAAFALDIALLPTPPYTPHLKGKVERLGGTLAGDLRVRLPAATTRPAAREGQAVPITLEGLAGELHDWVAAYHTRPHEGLGGATPLERWQADPTPVRQVDPAQVRWLLLGGQQRTITKHGIRFGGLHYLAAELNGRVGQQVEVRFMPHDHRQLEVYLDGAWLCTAIPQDLLGPAERDAVLARRRADAAELTRRRRRVRRAARARLTPLTGPGEPEEVTVIGRAQADREQRRHDDAALARLARTDLLGLEEIGARIQERNRAKQAGYQWPPPRPRQLSAGGEPSRPAPEHVDGAGGSD
jgi:putative transposase